ncbi:hypothetical protein DQQ10_06350 [Pseudochryseolinea flava]|uniref:Uncharacterized protein n=1 Tax=Pseudochryseolinea flava TaxID=2059302 RepID=A0A364Y5D2_9BACT|nr:hypothetical protein DQQ10_06350 [Pseudochryseolinea flava]
MTLTIDIAQTTGGSTISFPNAYLKFFKIESTNPTPITSSFSNGSVAFQFNGKGPVTIQFYVIPLEIGRTESEIYVNNDRFILKQFIFL